MPSFKLVAVLVLELVNILDKLHICIPLALSSQFGQIIGKPKQSQDVNVKFHCIAS